MNINLKTLTTQYANIRGRLEIHFQADHITCKEYENAITIIERIENSMKVIHLSLKNINDNLAAIQSQITTYDTRK